jgi:hypothetical protein
MTYLLCALLLAATSGPPKITAISVVNVHSQLQLTILASDEPVVGLMAGLERVLTISIDGAGQPQICDQQGFRIASFAVVKGRFELTLYGPDGKERSRVSTEMPGKPE